MTKYRQQKLLERLHIRLRMAERAILFGDLGSSEWFFAIRELESIREQLEWVQHGAENVRSIKSSRLYHERIEQKPRRHKR